MVKAREAVSLIKVITSPWTLGVVAAGVVVGIVLWNRKRGESFGETVGRTAGEEAAGVISGALTGAIKGAGEIPGKVEEALTEAIIGQTGYAMVRIPGRNLWPVQRNLLMVQGQLSEPEGEDSGTYTAEVQNTGTRDLHGVKVSLKLNKWGVDPTTETLGVVDIPARSGVRFHGSSTVRSLSGLVNVEARLYADSFLMGKTA